MDCNCSGACRNGGGCSGRAPLAGVNDYWIPGLIPNTNPFPSTTPQWPPQPVRLGWKCPQCSTIYSPDQVQCLRCTGNGWVTSTIGPITLNEDRPDRKDY